MPDQIQLRGGTEADNDAFTGVAREVTVDTTNKTLRVHDGTTSGGSKLAAFDEWGRLQVADPQDAQDATSKSYVDTTVADSVASELIAEVVVEGSSAASIVFDSIPADYRHLEIRGVLKSLRAGGQVVDTLFMRFNNDSGVNYDGQVASAAGTSLSASGTVDASAFNLGAISADGAPANTASPLVVDIPNYTGTTWEKGHTTQLGTQSGAVSGSQRRYFTSGWWNNTAAITRIDVFGANADLAIGSMLSLYGIRGA